MLTEIFTPPLSFPFKTQLHTPSIEQYLNYFQFFLPDFQNQFPKKEKIWSSVWAFIECYSSPPSECEQGENIFPVITKEQSGWNTLLFLYECGRGVDILNLFRCLFGLCFFFTNQRHVYYLDHLLYSALKSKQVPKAYLLSFIRM